MKKKKYIILYEGIHGTRKKKQQRTNPQIFLYSLGRKTFLLLFFLLFSFQYMLFTMWMVHGAWCMKHSGYHAIFVIEYVRERERAREMKCERGNCILLRKLLCVGRKLKHIQFVVISVVLPCPLPSISTIITWIKFFGLFDVYLAVTGTSKHSIWYSTVRGIRITQSSNRKRNAKDLLGGHWTQSFSLRDLSFCFDRNIMIIYLPLQI